jgi:hypothetical protein
MGLWFLDFESGEESQFAEEICTDLIRGYGIAVA